MIRRSLALLILAATIAAPAAAGPRWPDLTIAMGGTFAASGEPGNGGFNGAVAGMWPVDGPLSVGLNAFADDIGTRIAQYLEPGSPPKLLGTYESDHRFVYGAGWRLDLEPATRRRWRPFGTATWNYARVQDDARGNITNAQSSALIAVGLGIRRDVLQNSTLGVVTTYHRLADDRVKQYLGAAVEWGWRFDKTP
jgi:hypothetical protein